MESTLKAIDHSALKTNQAVIISLSLAAFVFDLPWLALATALVMAAGTALNRPGFGVIYRRLLKPAGLVKPDVLLDHAEPHRFAQGLGATFLFAGGLLLLGGASAAGWALVWLVIFLAALNLFAGFCAGCAAYYWLGRLKLPGFDKTPPQAGLPGMRSKVRVTNGN